MHPCLELTPDGRLWARQLTETAEGLREKITDFTAQAHHRLGDTIIIQAGTRLSAIFELLMANEALKEIYTRNWVHDYVARYQAIRSGEAATVGIEHSDPQEPAIQALVLSQHQEIRLPKSLLSQIAAACEAPSETHRGFLNLVPDVAGQVEGDSVKNVHTVKASSSYWNLSGRSVPFTQDTEDVLRQTIAESDDERLAGNLSYGLPHMFCPDNAYHLREAHAQELQDRARYWGRALAIEHTGWTEAEVKSRRNQGRLLELSAPATKTTPHRKSYPAEQFMPGFDTELLRFLNWLASCSCSVWATHQFLSDWTTLNKQGELINGWSVLALPDAPLDHEPLTDPVFASSGNRPSLMRPVYAPHTPKLALVDAFEAFAAQRRRDYEQRVLRNS